MGVYLARRLTRILAPYWTIAVPFAFAGFALGEAAWGDLWKLPLWLLGLGPVNPDTYQPISEAWWYVSLALQISLVMPVLLRVRRSAGLVPFTVSAVLVNAAALSLVGLAGDRWEYLAQGLVVCRLVEVIVGITVAELGLAGLSRGRTTAMALGSLALVMAVTPLLDLLGLWTGWQAMVGLTVLFIAAALLFSPAERSPERPEEQLQRAWTKTPGNLLTWAAALSYCFYLSHAPVSKYSGRLLAKLGLHEIFIALPVVLVACVFVAWVADLVARNWVAPRIAALFHWLLARRERRATPAL